MSNYCEIWNCGGREYRILGKDAKGQHTCLVMHGGAAHKLAGTKKYIKAFIKNAAGAVAPMCSI